MPKVKRNDGSNTYIAGVLHRSAPVAFSHGLSALQTPAELAQSYALILFTRTALHLDEHQKDRAIREYLFFVACAKKWNSAQKIAIKRRFMCKADEVQQLAASVMAHIEPRGGNSLARFGLLAEALAGGSILTGASFTASTETPNRLIDGRRE
jgi:hypothetical protein